MKMNKKGKMNGLMIAALVAMIAVAGLLVFDRFAPSPVEQAIIGELADGDGVSSELGGKTTTMTVSARDRAADDTNTRAAAPLYLITNPTVSDNEISGDFAADGTALSSTAGTSVTAGLTVGQDYVALAANDSWYGTPTAIKKISTQAETLDVDVWNVATSIEVELKREDGKILFNNGGTDSDYRYNISLAGNVDESFDRLKLKNNYSNSAYNLYGFYFNLPDASNVSSITGSGTTTGDASVGYSTDNVDYQSTSNDDKRFKFDEPILLLEFDDVKLANLQIQADGDGCVNEGISLYVSDTNWYKSSKSQSMKQGPEDDSDSPGDNGVAEVVGTTFQCVP